MDRPFEQEVAGPELAAVSMTNCAAERAFACARYILSQSPGLAPSGIGGLAVCRANGLHLGNGPTFSEEDVATINHEYYCTHTPFWRQQLLFLHAEEEASQRSASAEAVSAGDTPLCASQPPQPELPTEPQTAQAEAAKGLILCPAQLQRLTKLELQCQVQRWGVLFGREIPLVVRLPEAPTRTRKLLKAELLNLVLYLVSCGKQAVVIREQLTAGAAMAAPLV